MVCLKEIGKVCILSYFLMIFVSMLANQVFWENKLLHLFAQCTIGVHKTTGIILPITGKFMLQSSEKILNTVGVLGIILTFSGFYRSQTAIRVLLISSLLVSILAYLPVSIAHYKNVSSELISSLQVISANISLLWLID